MACADGGVVTAFSLFLWLAGSLACMMRGKKLMSHELLFSSFFFFFPFLFYPRFVSCLFARLALLPGVACPRGSAEVGDLWSVSA